MHNAFFFDYKGILPLLMSFDCPSWHGLQNLLDIVVQHNKAIDMSLNTQKSVCMVFPLEINLKLTHRLSNLYVLVLNCYSLFPLLNTWVT